MLLGQKMAAAPSKRIVCMPIVAVAQTTCLDTMQLGMKSACGHVGAERLRADLG